MNILGGIIIIYDLTLVSILMFSAVCVSIVVGMMSKLKAISLEDNENNNNNNNTEMTEEELKYYYT